jgi:hypothetical protein
MATVTTIRIITAAGDTAGTGGTDGTDGIIGITGITGDPEKGASAPFFFHLQCCQQDAASHDVQWSIA